MKISAILAMLLVALDCASRATGSTPQAIFSEQAVWLWWIISGFWAMGGAVAFFTLEERHYFTENE